MILLQIPTEHGLDGQSEPALAVGIVGAEHEDVGAQEIDHALGDRCSFGNLDTLKIAPAGDVIVNRLLERRQRFRDRAWYALPND